MAFTERIGSSSRGQLTTEDMIALTHGMKLVVQDYGNGVRRILSAGIVPVDELKAESALEGRHRVPFPAPCWMRDLAVAYIESMGIEPTQDFKRVASVVYARHISEDTIEVFGWREQPCSGGSGGIRTHGTF